jgi:MerR family transcriptional regulator, heat shock protein HspR
VSDPGKPLYLISVVADMLKVHPQTLRLYERKGLIRPSRTVGRTRMYSEEDVDDVRRILRLTRDLGVNLAGVEIILKLRRQMMLMQQELEELASYARQQAGTAPQEERADRGGLVRVADRRLQRLDDF